MTTEATWPLRNHIAAWAVHAFTMTGLLWVLLAAQALIDGDHKRMWMWLGVALIVDAADGPLARAAKVTEVVPWFSGVMLDNVVDYLTWTFLPAVFLAITLPLGAGSLPVVAATLVLVSSMFCYANTLMKSSDWYFVGFPAAWNIVIVCLWMFAFGAVINWIVIIVFAVLALVPWKWVHPFRVRQYRVYNGTAAAVWVLSTSLMVWQHPVMPIWLLIPWAISGAWLIVVSGIRTWRDKPDMA